jgi:hypothetical protein
VPFLYRTGEEIRPGDRILYAGDPGEVEFVVTATTGDPAMDWYLEEFPGGGFMINTSKFGRVFLDDPKKNEDLQFVSRPDPSRN